jgi:hypothetical protein
MLAGLEQHLLLLLPVVLLRVEAALQYEDKIYHLNIYSGS